MRSRRTKWSFGDDHEKKNRTEITFNNNVNIKNIKLRKDLLVVVLEDKIFVFNFETLKLVEQVETCQNPLGLCAIATDEKPISKTIVCLHVEKGSLKTLNDGKLHLNKPYLK